MGFTNCVFFEGKLSQFKNQSHMTDIFETCLNLFSSLGLNPNWLSISQDESRSPFKKINLQENLRKKEMDGADGFSFVYTLPGSDAPGYEHLINFGYMESKVADRFELSCAIEESYIDFNSNEFELLSVKLARVCAWDFGYALQHPSDRSPLMFAGGGLTNLMSQSDRVNVEKWFISYYQYHRRLKAVRDIYKYNFLSSSHFGVALKNYSTLGSFINANPEMSLIRLKNDRYLWKVPHKDIEQTREILAESGLILTA